MRNKWKKLLCLLLAVLMLGTVLTACNKQTGTPSRPDKENTQNEPGTTDEPSNPTKPDQPDKPGKPDQNSGGYVTLAEETGYGYVASYKPLDYGFEYMYNLKLLNDRLYFNAYRAEDDYQTGYWSMKQDGSDLQKVPMPEFREAEYLNTFCPADDGWWMLTYEWIMTNNGGTGTGGDLDPFEPVEDDDDWMNSTEGDEGWTGEGTEGETDEGTWIDYADGDIAIEEPVYPYANGYEIYRLYRTDLEGNIFSQLDITELTSADEYFWISNMYGLPDGGLLMFGDAKAYKLDSTGKVAGMLEVPSWIENSLCLDDGRVFVSYYGEEGRVCCWLNTDTMELGEQVKLGTNENTYYSYYTGGGKYDLYLDDDNVLYGCYLDTGEMEPLLNWMDSDMDKYSMSGFCVLDESNILFLYNSENGGTEMGSMKRVPFSELPVRTTITAGGMYLDWNLRTLITEFNRTNEEYRISFIDYSKYNTEENYNAGMERMNMDVVSGGGPDILQLDSSMNVSNYVSKGLLMDLYSFMGSGAEYQKEDLVQGYRNAAEISGALYQLCGSFSIQGFVTLAEYVGDDGVLSMNELLAACNQLGEEGEIIPYNTKDGILSMILATSRNQLVDPMTGECHFNTPEFAQVLEFVNRFPAEIDWENYVYTYSNTYDKLRAREQLLADFYFYSFEDLYYTLPDMGLLNATDLQDLAIVGYPSMDGAHMVLSGDTSLAINANTKYPDASWQLVSRLLGDSYQDRNSYQLSVRKDKLLEQAAKAMEEPYYLDENGEKVVYERTYWVDDHEVKVNPLTQEQVDLFLAVIDNVSGNYQYDEELYKVVSEEAAAYFAGQKPADEVARLIQSRVQIYVNEQR